jgi:hypothetical protein
MRSISELAMILSKLPSLPPSSLRRYPVSLLSFPLALVWSHYTSHRLWLVMVQELDLLLNNLSLSLTLSLSFPICRFEGVPSHGGS